MPRHLPAPLRHDHHERHRDPHDREDDVERERDPHLRAGGEEVGHGYETNGVHVFSFRRAEDRLIVTIGFVVICGVLRPRKTTR